MMPNQLAKGKNRIVAMSIAAVLSAVSVNMAEAKPGKWKDHPKYNGHDNGAAWWKHEKRHRVKKKYYVGDNYYSLPHGCRRVVIRERTYYTLDNLAYFVFNPLRNVYVVVDPWR
jgi:hypothetical protein